MENKKTEIIPITASNLENSAADEIFSKYTHPVLETFIQKVIDQNKESLPSAGSQKLVREFFLYGFLKASGQSFKYDRSSQYTCERSHPGDEGFFHTNNGVLALHDFDGELYIRGGESWHGYFDMGDGMKPQGIEGTLLNSGYDSRNVRVPHSNGEVYENPSTEKLFKALKSFSKEVWNLRGAPTSGIIIKDLSEPEPEAPYRARDSKLPRIILQDFLIIPGNIQKTILVEKNKTGN